MRTFDSKLFKAKNQEKEWIVYKTKGVIQHSLKRFVNLEKLTNNVEKPKKKMKKFRSFCFNPMTTGSDSGRTDMRRVMRVWTLYNH